MLHYRSMDLERAEGSPCSWQLNLPAPTMAGDRSDYFQECPLEVEVDTGMAAFAAGAACFCGTLCMLEVTGTRALHEADTQSELQACDALIDHKPATSSAV